MRNPTAFIACAILVATMTGASAGEGHGCKSRTVSVSARATGAFGRTTDGYLPMVEALAVEHGSTISISTEGSWCFGYGLCTGPDGSSFNEGNFLVTPLEESIGVVGGNVTNLGALIGAFVPQVMTDAPGFKPLDGTKSLSQRGIMPNMLFFVGRYNAIQVSGPGTLYLGINDNGVIDNSGSLKVSVRSCHSEGHR